MADSEKDLLRVRIDFRDAWLDGIGLGCGFTIGVSIAILFILFALGRMHVLNQWLPPRPPAVRSAR